MKKQKTHSGQTLADVAIQTKGTIEALVDIAEVNGISVTDVMGAHEVTIPDKTYSPTLQRYIHARGIAPATSKDNSAVRLHAFTQQFSLVFA